MSKCSECGKPCEGEFIDLGIGPYEFWGQRGVDSDVQYVSECCEAPVIDDNGTQDTGPDRWDYEEDTFRNGDY